MIISSNMTLEEFLSRSDILEQYPGLERLIDTAIEEAVEAVLPEESCLSLRGEDWQAFADEVTEHIENYTVPQYGDKGEDMASDYTAQDCVNQVKKYMARHGRNSRPGQDRLDLLKSAHYLQLAASLLEGEDNDK